MSNAHSPRVIAGFGRSGTTWVQDVLAESNNLRPVFEPLHPGHIQGADEFAHSYRSADERDERLYAQLHPFLLGTPSTLWTDYRVDRRTLVPRLSRFQSWNGFKRYARSLADARSNRSRFRPHLGHGERLVKFIRANMLLSWLKRWFDARIVFVIRHPAAVVMSQINASRTWRPVERLDRYRADPRLLEVLRKPFKELLQQSHDSVEACTLAWCLENSIALEQAAASGIRVVYYEHLLSRGQTEWSGILAALDLVTMPGADLIGRPSQQAWGPKANDARLIKRYDSWMSIIDHATASRIQYILDCVGMRMYSVTDPDPQGAAF